MLRILSVSRSTRSVEALTAFVKQKYEATMQEFADDDELNRLMDNSKRNFIAYVVDKNSVETRNLQVFYKYSVEFFTITIFYNFDSSDKVDKISSLFCWYPSES